MFANLDYKNELIQPYPEFACKSALIKPFGVL